MSKFPVSKFQHLLLSWFRRSARDLPWRRTKDPYKIWVSEIMLQQTQVVTVIPYYQKWIKRFPSVESLARAPLSEVMKYWAGLGYYRRVRMLHEGAKKIVKKYGGQVPNDVHALMKLPGIGRYTAGAIASIAFGISAPILDGNVIRILTRIFAIKKDIQKPETKRQLWELSSVLVPNKNPGAFNEAMMELGATVCLPENPSCGKCPVSKMCRAHLKGKETAYPVNSKDHRLEKLTNVALILIWDGKVLLQKQPAGGRWGGLWMFPFWKDRQTMRTETGLRDEDLKHLMTVRHGFTKYQIALKVFQMQDTRFKMRESKTQIQDTRYKILDKKNNSLASGILHLESRRNFRWIPLQKLASLALPSPHKKIAEKILSSI